MSLFVGQMTEPPPIQVVEGTVIAVDVDRAAERSRVALKSASGPVVSFAVPGTNGLPTVVYGIPRFAVGERYSVDLVEARVGWTPARLGDSIHRLDGAPRYALNGIHWGADQLPRRYELNTAGIPGLTPQEAEAVVRAALDQWNGVRCADFGFEYAGTTDDTVAVDGRNILAWKAEDWEWSPEVAGLTMTRFDTTGEEPRPSESDIWFNAANWVWTTGLGDVYASPARLNAGSVITHELGHVTGMDHEFQRVTSTMFYAYFGGDWGATLSGDDRRGLCENYPNGTPECSQNADCEGVDSSERVCGIWDGVAICDEVRDPVGAACARTSINCEDRCVFTNASATDGFCSVACASDDDCPEAFHCGETSQTYVPTQETTLCLPGAPEVAGDTDSDTAASSETDGSTKASGCGCAVTSGNRALVVGWPMFSVIAGLWGWRARRTAIRRTVGDVAGRRRR